MQLEKYKKNPPITVKHFPEHMDVWEKKRGNTCNECLIWRKRDYKCVLLKRGINYKKITYRGKGKSRRDKGQS